MKSLLLLAITLPLLLGGCSIEEPVTETKFELEGVNAEKLEEREGLAYVKGSDAPYTGKVYGLYENGQKFVELNYKDGKRDGLNLQWYENGQKGLEEIYKDGKMPSKALQSIGTVKASLLTHKKKLIKNNPWP